MLADASRSTMFDMVGMGGDPAGRQRRAPRDRFLIALHQPDRFPTHADRLGKLGLGHSCRLSQGLQFGTLHVDTPLIAEAQFALEKAKTDSPKSAYSPSALIIDKLSVSLAIDTRPFPILGWKAWTIAMIGYRGLPGSALDRGGRRRFSRGRCRWAGRVCRSRSRRARRHARSGRGRWRPSSRTCGRGRRRRR